jgi:hypothetical protein
MLCLQYPQIRATELMLEKINHEGHQVAAEQKSFNTKDTKDTKDQLLVCFQGRRF